MRTTAGEVEKARAKLAEHLDKYVGNPAVKKEISSLVAKFTAAVVRDDRVRRQPASSLAKLADVFFNGRPA